MKTQKNQFGELVTRWESSIHPDNPNFMQTVYFTAWVKKDGRELVGYKLDQQGGKMVFLYDMSKNEALAKFTEKLYL